MPLSRLAPPRVAIVGGGMAGLTCARVLLRHGVRVLVVDKARKPGGDDEAGVALAGDWLGGGRVEGAFLSRRRAAAGVLASLRRARAATSP